MEGAAARAEAESQEGVTLHPAEEEEEQEQDCSSVNGRMEITEAELSWALTLKEAIEEDEEIDNLNDFWYAQLAIVCQDDVNNALKRAAHMQAFRIEYDVRDTLEDAKRTVWEFLNLFEEDWILSFNYSQEHETYVWVVDIAKIDKDYLKTQRAWRTNLAGVYYLRQALCPDLFSIGNGISIVHECDGFDYSGKFGGTGHVTRLAKEVIGEYPAKHHSLLWFNTGMFVNLMMSMVKPFLPKEMKDKFQFGCKCDSRLDEYYMVPDPLTARQRNYARIMQTLKTRYDNETKFKM